MADENEESQAGENEAPKKDAKRKKEAFPALNRPIILVCNDGWARAVRPVIPIVLRMKIQCASEAKLDWHDPARNSMKTFTSSPLSSDISCVRSTGNP